MTRTGFGAARSLAVLATCLLAACAHGPRIADYREARALSDQGLALMNEGDDAGAIKLLSRVIAYNGGEVQDFTRRATAYAALNQNDAALRDLDHAVGLGPDRWRTYLLRAVTEQKLGRFDAAIHDLDTASALQPTEAELVRRRGYLRLVAGRFDEAVADYDRLSQMQPASGVGPFGRGVALYLSGDWAAAAATFEQQLRAQPRDGVAALWLVKAALRAGAPITWDQLVAQAGPEPEWVMIRALLAEDADDAAAQTLATLGSGAAGQRAVGACERDLFLGTWGSIKGHNAAALTHLDSAQRACPADSIEGAEARTELGRVQRTHN